MRLGNEILVVDIETIERPEPDWHRKEKLEKIEAKYNAQVKKADGYKKDETVAKYRAEAEKAKADALGTPTESWKFSPAGASIVSAAYSIGSRNSKGIDWSIIQGFQGAEQSVVHDLGVVINEYLAPGFTLAGYNILSFDWPVLARAFQEHEVHLINKPSDYVFDVMQAPLFKRSNHSQDYWCQQYGIEGNYETDGSMVASMWAADAVNKTQKVKEYCQDDVEKCCKLIDINVAVFNL